VDAGILRNGIPPALLWLAVGSWLAAMTLVEIFYIGGSFGLYLNCRTHLEGWDVELAFRRLGKRLAGVAAALALLLCPVAFGAAKRADSADVTGEKAAAHEKISTILAHQDFEIHKTKIRMPKDTGPGTDHSGVGNVFQGIGYVIFWAVVAFAVWKLIEFIIKYRHTLKTRLGTKAAIKPAAKSVMGLDVTPESLPDDVVRVAREKWEEGDFHGALSLLYRGSLSWLLVHAALPVRDSDTEGDCLRHTQKLPDAAPRGYFEKLTVQWIAAAYGSRAPANEIMRALFDEWPFGAGRASR
jgi:phosphatidylglycerophosphate synthase